MQAIPFQKCIDQNAVVILSTALAPENNKLPPTSSGLQKIKTSASNLNLSAVKGLSSPSVSMFSVNPVNARSNASFFKGAKNRQQSILSVEDRQAIDQECESMEINEENFRGRQ
jgi:hypothetical protein